ncbi:hypothetical protein FI667_g12035, partial [Globisporangium splendens]
MTGGQVAASNPVRYEIADGDFCGFLKGFWKRNLEWRHFGGSFKHLRSTNNVVFIEEDLDAAHQPNTQFLKWSFGRTHKKEDLVSAYTIQVGVDNCGYSSMATLSYHAFVFAIGYEQFIPDEQGTFMEWSFEGVTCHGVFKPESSVAIFNFCLQESMVTITYRILDANTMAVCIVDVDSEHTPTIQYGNIELIKYEGSRKAALQTLMAMATRHVLVGGTFACDDALEQPLELLLREAVVGGDGVDVEWLPYGSASQFASWTPLLQRSSRCIDMVVLLIRVSDLEAAHPELVNGASVVASSSGQSTALMSLVHDLEAYNATASFPPLLLAMCPSPPSQERQCSAQEHEFAQRVQSLRKIIVQPSMTLTELFAIHNDPDTKFYDRISDKRKHSPYYPSMLNVLSLSLCRQICRLIRTTKKKVIVLDCDNTLWGGAVAEVGVHGIQLSDEFLALQRFVVQQQKQGMLLCLCSKNILQDVVDVFEQRKSDMVLRLDEHIVISKVNWQTKSANIAMIAEELSLGLDSFIFIDDNPVECNEVASQLPMVAVINIPPTFSARFLDEQWIFDDKIDSEQASSASSTREDAQRTQMYQQNVQRSQLLQSSTSQKTFLSSLGVKIVFEDIIVPARQDSETDSNETQSSFARVLQLHQRTNQFNIATSFSRKLTHESLAEYIAGSSEKNRVICSHVTDRFGHYGLVCVALCRPGAAMKTLHVDSFLLSCRALNRGVEHAMIQKLAEIADALGAETIEFCWEPTDRNEPARLLFSSLSEFSFTATKGNFTKRVESKDDKHRLSASAKGKWEITTSKAASVAFLKVEEARQDAVKQASLTRKTTLLSSIVSFARMVTQALLKLAQCVLPRWLVIFICSRVNTGQSKLQHLRELGLLRRSFHERHSLNSFVAEHIPQVTEGIADGQSDAEVSDEQEDSKFRRKARHQTKMVLLNHLNDENPDVVWSANRRADATSQPHDFDGDSAIPVSSDSDVLVLRRQIPCTTPACASTLQKESQCAFQRCRSCCYKIQRLVSRVHGKNVHEKARQMALETLLEQFDLAIDSKVGDDERSIHTGSCPVHTNARRIKQTL